MRTKAKEKGKNLRGRAALDLRTYTDISTGYLDIGESPP
jgi:hypothetical protein